MTYCLVALPKSFTTHRPNKMPGTQLSPSQKANTKTKIKIPTPDLFKVVVFNDDYTPMEFVVHVLMHIFGHSEDTASTLMLRIHEKGNGVAGTYPFEIAETKATETMSLARNQKYPLNVKVMK